MKFEQMERQEAAEKGFDPENLVEEEEWQAVNEKVAGYKEDGNWTEYFDLAADVVEAFPEKSSDFKIYEEDVSSRAWSQGKAQLDAYKGERKWEKFFKLASSMGTVFEERVGELKDEGIIDEKAEAEMSARLSEDKEGGSWLDFFRNVGMAKKLFPEMLGDIDVEDKLGEIKASMDKRKKPGRWASFCEQAAGLESLGYDVSINEGDWEKIEEDFKKAEKSGDDGWIAFAADIKSLSR